MNEKNDAASWIETAADLGLQHVKAPVSDEVVIFNPQQVTEGFLWVKPDELLGCDAAGEPVKLISQEKALALMNRLRKLNK